MLLSALYKSRVKFVCVAHVFLSAALGVHLIPRLPELLGLQAPVTPPATLVCRMVISWRRMAIFVGIIINIAHHFNFPPCLLFSIRCFAN